MKREHRYMKFEKQSLNKLGEGKLKANKIGAEVYLFLTRASFVSLFSYSGAIKFANFSSFQIQLRRQPFSEEIINILIWALPFTELLVALLITLPNTWKIGIQISFVSMISFTIYTVLAASGSFGYIPCACGGFIKEFSWWQHVFFNAGLTVMAGICLSTIKKHKI